ncbi:MAG: hypothetical protein AAF827_18805 [Cyanobacteria bacterium P01_D01_bin.6]
MDTRLTVVSADEPFELFVLARLLQAGQVNHRVDNRSAAAMGLAVTGNQTFQALPGGSKRLAGGPAIAIQTATQSRRRLRLAVLGTGTL